MKNFMRKTPAAIIVLIVALSSGLFAFSFTPLIINATGSTLLQASNIIVIPALIISALVSLPVVYFYRKVIIENFELIECLKKDALTGLLNRHTFFDLYINKIKTIEKNDLTMALIMMDIDNFKSINDRYGHFAGDKAISSVADILRKNIKKSDLICRFGGEEFLILLWDITCDEAISVSQRLLQELNVKIEFESQKISFTTSVGLAYFKQCSMLPDEYLIRADEALYEAKNSGKNRLGYQCYQMNKEFRKETIKSA